MSKLSMHAISAPVFVRMLHNLSAMLTKAEQQAKAKGYDPTILLSQRLAPDMFPLMRQVQITTDHAKGAMARLAGKSIEAIEDRESTFADLHARINKVTAIVESFTEAQLEGAEKRDVTLKLPTGDMKLDGLTYLVNFAFPNFYFHAATAYDILRHNGIELGKRDFLMG